MPKELREQGSVKDRYYSIIDCSNHASLNLPEQDWESYIKLAKLTYAKNRRKRIYLCNHHYSQAKKEKKKENRNGIQKKGFLSNSPKPYKMRM